MEARQALILKLKMTWYSINWNNWWRSKKKTKMKTDHDQETVKFWLLLFSFKKWIESAQLCPTLCDPMDCSPPGSSLHKILQTRILERVPFPTPGDAISYSRGSSRPMDQTHHISWVSCISRWFFTTSSTWEATRNLDITYLNSDEKPKNGWSKRFQSNWTWISPLTGSTNILFSSSNNLTLKIRRLDQVKHVFS